MTKSLVRVVFAMIFLGAGFNSFADENLNDQACESLLESPLGKRVASLEDLFPGLSAEIFFSTRTISKDGDKLDFKNFDEVYRNLKSIEDRVYPRGTWLQKIENLIRDVEDEFTLGQVESRVAKVRLAGIIYEAAVAANIPSDEIFVEENLSKIAHNFRAERISGKLEPLKHKRIDLGWFENGRLNVIEAKNISPKVFNGQDPDLLDWLCLKITRQSTGLVRAIKAYGIPITTFLVGRTIPVVLEERLESFGGGYDHYIEYDPVVGSRLKF